MFCSNCGANAPENTAFCPNCGTALMAPQQPVQPQQPVYQQPVQPQQPYAPGQPYMVVRPRRPGRGFGITSLVLGIIGIVYAVIVFAGAMELASSSFVSAFLADEYAVGALIYSVFGILSTIFGILGRKRGYRCGVSMSGLVMGIISTALYFLSAVIVMAA